MQKNGVLLKKRELEESSSLTEKGDMYKLSNRQGHPRLTSSWLIYVGSKKREYYFKGTLVSICNFSLRVNLTTSTFLTSQAHTGVILLLETFFVRNITIKYDYNRKKNCITYTNKVVKVTSRAIWTWSKVFDKTRRFGSAIDCHLQ